jgi:DNA recombination-dependent growth factor C
MLQASVSLSRYRAVEQPQPSALAEVPQKLKEYAFRDIDGTTDERSFGWVNFDDMLDSNWSVSPPEKGDFFAFALRLDTRRVQPAVLKKHVQIALNDELVKAKEQGRKFVGRDRKREIKEQVALKLRARALPIPAVFPVVWAPADNRIYFESTNAKAKSLFEDLFSDTFQLTLEPLTPFFMALETLGEEAVSRLENLEITSFVESGA